MKDIALHIMDIAENSITAGADKISIVVDIDEKKNTLTVSIKDNGQGMDPGMLQRVESPFETTRTTRKVGMGIPLFKMGAEAAGGRFAIKSVQGKGTAVKAVYGLSHIDRPPLGDLSGVLSALALANTEIDFAFTVQKGGEKFVCDTHEIKERLDGVPLSTPEVSLWLIQYLQEGIDGIFGGRF